MAQRDPRVSEHHKDQLLDLLFYVLPMDIRARVMNELPAAYNAYIGRDVCKVVRTEDSTPITGSDSVRMRLVNGPADPLKSCEHCGHPSIEHDPMDARCPDDDDEARANRDDNGAA